MGWNVHLRLCCGRYDRNAKEAERENESARGRARETEKSEGQMQLDVRDARSSSRSNDTVEELSTATGRREKQGAGPREKERIVADCEWREVRAACVIGNAAGGAQPVSITVSCFLV